MRLLDNKWLYLFIVLVTDLVKITIPFCAILCMSRLFGNTKISKAVLIVSAVMIIISFTMNTYEVMSLFDMLDNFATGQIGFFTTLTGGPMSYSFGRIHLIVEFIPAVLQTIICLSNGDKKSVDIQEG